MVGENWKILLDYKSERKRNKTLPKQTTRLLFWEVKLFHVSLRL